MPSSKHKTPEKIFTGQALIDDGILRYERRESVRCDVCDKSIGLRTVRPEDDGGLAWFDPYKQKYVCYGCLSPQRLKEIQDGK